MELTCALVLAVIGIVTASPSGYGIKSGAVANANAAAGGYAGAIGQLPAIPNGAEYSGSYSKSSSSSSAASSSSSSSSSFSFNGKGYIPSNAIGGDISSPGAACSTGNCQNGVKGTPGYGLGSAGTGANAAATAGAGAFTGSSVNTKPCLSGDCSKNSELECNGLNCNNQQKCSSGLCSSPTFAPATTLDESDDIPVNIVGNPKNSYNPNDKSYSSTSTSTTFGSGCIGANCGSASTPKSTYVSPVTYPSQTGSFEKPASYLTTPKEQAPCTSPNCGIPSASSYDSPTYNNAPNYNSNSYPSAPEKPCSSGNCAIRPSYGSIPSAPSGNNCESGNCGKPLVPTYGSGSKNPTNSDSLPPFVPLVPTGPPNCRTPNCASAPLPPPSKYPSYPQSGSYGGGPKPIHDSPTPEKRPYTGGFGGPPGILKPNDYSPPTGFSSSNYKPPAPTGSYNFPSVSTIPHDQNTAPTSSTFRPPVYTAPTSSTFRPPVYTAPTSSPYRPPVYHPTTSPTVPTYRPVTPTGSYKPPCTSGNCVNSPSSTTAYPIYPPYAPAESPSEPLFKPTGPSPCLSGNCGPQPLQPGFGTPTSTGSYAPTSCSSGNCATKPNPPLFNQNPTVNYQKPTSPGNTYVACSSGNCAAALPSSSPEPTSTGSYPSSSCTSGNCGNQPSQSPNYGQAVTSTSSATGAYNNGQNSFTSTSFQSKPSYSFGGPPGLLKPNDYNSPAASTPNYKPTVSSPYNPPPTPTYKPTSPGSYNPTSCASGNCGTNSGFTTPSHDTPYKPTGSGSYNPTPIQSSPSAPSYNQYKPTSPGAYNPPPCTSGNCGIQTGPSAPSNNGQYKPPGSYSPGCASGNCGTQPGHSSSQFGHNSGAHSSAGSFASANAIAYTGGFGGPPGVLKPFDNGKLTGNGLTLGGIQPAGSYGSPSLGGINSAYSKTLKDGNGASVGAGAQASAISGAQAYSGNYGGSGCKDGCGSNGGNTYGLGGSSEGNNYGLSGVNGGGNYGLSGTNGGSNYGHSGVNGGSTYGLNGSNGSSNYGLRGANAKSVSGAVGNAGAGGYGFSGSFASSSASAQASAGAATKGGYGKR